MLDLHIFFLSDQGILSPIVRDTGRLVATHEVVKPRPEQNKIQDIEVIVALWHQKLVLDKVNIFKTIDRPLVFLLCNFAEIYEIIIVKHFDIYSCQRDRLYFPCYDYDYLLVDIN
jgi:hypothetical protein